MGIVAGGNSRTTRAGVKRRPIRGANDTIRTQTLREFDGMMVTSENDLNLQTKYAKRLINMVRGVDGALSVRQGTRLDLDVGAAEQWSATSEVVTFEYFAGSTRVGILGSSYPPVIGQKLFISVAEDVNFPAAVAVVDFGENGFQVVNTTTSATSFTATRTITWSIDEWFDDEADIIYGTYIHGREIYVTTTGHILGRRTDDRIINLFDSNVARFGAMTHEETSKVKVVNGSNTFKITMQTTAADRPLVGDLIKLSGLDETVGGIEASAFNNYHYVISVEVLSGSGPTFPTLIEFQLGQTANATADSTGDITIHSDLIRPAAWSACDLVTSAEFNNALILCNGIDKPVRIDVDAYPEPYAQYVFDPATGTNVNTPIAKYIVAGQDHVVMAGIVNRPNIVSISQTNTYNTWFGDAGPNNAVEIDISRIVNNDSSTITGITFHRDLLVVTTDNWVIFYRLNNFVDDLHVPLLVDAVNGFGSISHRSLASIGDNLLACDYVGVNNLKETLLKDRFASNRVSEPIAPTIVNIINGLSVVTADREMWHMHDKRSDSYMLFMPVVTNDIRETWVFNFMRKESKRVQGWSVLRGWNFNCGWLSSTGRTKFTSGMKIYIYGATGDDITADFVGVPAEVSVEDVTPESFVDWFALDSTVLSSLSFRTDITGGCGVVVNNALVIGRRYRAVWTDCTSSHDIDIELRMRVTTPGAGDLIFADLRGSGSVSFTATQPGVYIRRPPSSINTVVSFGSFTVEEVEETDRVPINFVWEMPWIDLGRRMHSKTSRYIKPEVKGTARFTMQMFVDNLYLNRLLIDDSMNVEDDFALNDALIPALAMQMLGGDSAAFGVGEQPYGSGRLTTDERLYAWNARFVIAKLRFYGSTIKPLRFVSITLGYQDGDIRR